jgi:hypothetical protein
MIPCPYCEGSGRLSDVLAIPLSPAERRIMQILTAHEGAFVSIGESKCNAVNINNLRRKLRERRIPWAIQTGSWGEQTYSLTRVRA